MHASYTTFKESEDASMSVKSELKLARELTAELKRRGLKVTVAGVSTWANSKCRAARLWLERFPSFDDWIEERAGMPSCRACGCTEDDPCDEGCEWAEADLCSACAQKKTV